MWRRDTTLLGLSRPSESHAIAAANFFPDLLVFVVARQRTIASNAPICSLVTSSGRSEPDHINYLFSLASVKRAWHTGSTWTKSQESSAFGSIGKPQHRGVDSRQEEEAAEP